MKRTITGIALLVSLLTGVGAGTPSASADPGLQSASGFGQVHLGLPFRNFAFSATKSADGTASGNAQLENRATGFRGHIAIDCLNVLGNTAVMSGVVISSTSPNIPVGSDAFFAVQDNGEGPNAPPDEITSAYFFLGIPCTYVTDPAQLALFFYTIETGEIQVSS
ncbi:MAG TPA: hypothetical protein VEQ37_10740 [Actinomycetota bacterium]|nr:hypothetical protein [Actinomycetota bacterium]